MEAARASFRAYWRRRRRYGGVGRGRHVLGCGVWFAILYKLYPDAVVLHRIVFCHIKCKSNSEEAVDISGVGPLSDRHPVDPTTVMRVVGDNRKSHKN